MTDDERERLTAAITDLVWKSVTHQYVGNPPELCIDSDGNFFTAPDGVGVVLSYRDEDDLFGLFGENWDAGVDHADKDRLHEAVVAGVKRLIDQWGDGMLAEGRAELREVELEERYGPATAFCASCPGRTMKAWIEPSDKYVTVTLSREAYDELLWHLGYGQLTATPETITEELSKMICYLVGSEKEELEKEEWGKNMLERDVYEEDSRNKEFWGL